MRYQSINVGLPNTHPAFTRWVMACTFGLSLVIFASPAAHASVGGEIVKAIGRYLAKETGQEASEQAVKQLTKQVGEELIESTAQKIIREGGEKSLIEVSELVAKHGPEVVRALDNAPSALPVLKLLDELPADEVGKAASRVAAGSTGKELATLGTKHGIVVLRSEVKHPGIGLKFTRALGSDGAELSLKLSNDQAITIGRHVDDIALLPKTEQAKLLALIGENTDRFCAFVGRFVEKNPSKVLFTAASVPVILANSDAIFGEGDITFDADGNVLRDQNGNPILHQTGIIPNIANKVSESLQRPIQWTGFGIGAVVVFLIALFGIMKVWGYTRKDRLAISAAKINSDPQAEENAGS